MTWRDGIDLARTARELQAALEDPMDSVLAIELAGKLASQALEHVGSDAELVGEYGEFTTALDASHGRDAVKASRYIARADGRLFGFELGYSERSGEWVLWHHDIRNRMFIHEIKRSKDRDECFLTIAERVRRWTGCKSLSIEEVDSLYSREPERPCR